MQLKINTRVFSYLKYILILFAFIFLVNKTLERILISDFVDFIMLSFTDTRFILFLFVLLILCILNWGLEAYKWHFIRKKPENYWNSYASVLCGLGLSMFMPNRGGEFIGRVLYISDTKIIKNSILSIITSYGQQLITVISGVSSLYIVNQYIKLNNQLLMCISLLGILFSITYFLLPFILKWKFWSRFKFCISEVNLYQLAYIASISMIRFLVFSIQYFILFIYFDVINETNIISIFAMLSVQFLITSYVPSFILFDAGIKSSISVYLFDMLNIYPQIALTITLIIWLVNVFIPSLTGIIISINLRSPQVIE